MQLLRFFQDKQKHSILKKEKKIAAFSKWTEAVAQRSSVKKVFLEISQNSQENTCTRVIF